MQTHKDLTVFKESMNFVEKIYTISSKFPKQELFGLTSQLRRASVSIPSNISEGAARPGQKELIRFLYIALSSLTEVETQIEIAYRLKYVPKNSDLDRNTIYIRRMLRKMIRSLSV